MKGHQCEGAIEHYKKKFEGGRVNATDDSIDVFCKNGKHQVAMRRNGAGQWVCVSEAHGCESRHDLSHEKKEEKSA